MQNHPFGALRESICSSIACNCVLRFCPSEAFDALAQLLVQSAPTASGAQVLISPVPVPALEVEEMARGQALIRRQTNCWQVFGPLVQQVQRRFRLMIFH